jgi:predicted MFS family arabinose efflux permease
VFSINTPPSVAPLLSGLLLIRWNWAAIFWFLSIASSLVFLAILLFLPETCRNVVGDGSRHAPRFNRALAPVLSPEKPTSKSTPLLDDEKGKTNNAKGANPLLSLRLLKCRSTMLAVVCYSVYYTIYSCLQASLSTIFVETYHVSGLVAGLSYIPFGVACVVASFLAGKFIDLHADRSHVGAQVPLADMAQASCSTLTTGEQPGLSA